jgi:hypothetical protein
MIPTSARTALVVVESMFGNTDQIGRAVAEGLNEAGVETVVIDVTSAQVDLPTDVDLLVVGAPTHALSLSKPSTRVDAIRQGASEERVAIGVREWLTKVQPHDPRRPPVVAVFDTRLSKVRRLPAAAGPRAAHLARRRGLQLLGRPKAFLVSDVTGPLVDGELTRAQAWGRELAAEVSRPAGRSA